MENEKLIAKTKKQLTKLGYSEEKINEFLADLEKEDEPSEPSKPSEPSEPKKEVEEKPSEEKIVDVNESETTTNEEVKEEPVVDYEAKYNELKAYVDNALKGINDKFEGLNAKTEKSYEMLSALGSVEEPKEEEIKEDKFAKMFGGYASESFHSEETKGDFGSNLFEHKEK